MSGAPRLAQIWRHPVKALSRERLPAVVLEAGAPLPLDRRWAVTHANARFDGTWAPKGNFLRGVSAPALMAVTSTHDPDTGRLTLAHPEQDEIEIDPEDAAASAALVAWLGPLWPESFPPPTGLVSADTALTDVPEPWVAVNNCASHRAVADRLGDPGLSIHRWRGNLWLDGLAPWEEFDWPGQCLRIGEAVLEVQERITRCMATAANPESGRRDRDTLAALRSWDHEDFGVYARVVEGGEIAEGAAVTLP
ncbi:MOSC domain-containing protein [Rhodovulum sp. 12E13]|uniref:MOSC domain-containing protein n=1 Tax=Rhodovulum sp. 12E13 TaxID=2203891 RepID=UPI000E12B3DD|nr:MOSC N-terminal beta barrel domain-containing protein [Rhodovulum sp. 12E13]RDC70925.1 MOSC domain-containing protein [Rhodovulum sp. 12E13]